MVQISHCPAGWISLRTGSSSPALALEGWNWNSASGTLTLERSAKNWRIIETIEFDVASQPGLLARSAEFMYTPKNPDAESTAFSHIDFHTRCTAKGRVYLPAGFFGDSRGLHAIQNEGANPESFPGADIGYRSVESLADDDVVRPLSGL